MGAEVSLWKPALKTVVFSVLVPGTVGGLLPQLLIRSFPGVALWEMIWLSWVGWPVVVLGTIGYLWCAWEFVGRGLGTPAVTDPPVRLVVSGLYRFSRNPMYVSVLLLIVGQALIEGSGLVFGYGMVVWCLFFSFVRWFEEPQLRERFGVEYDQYVEEVPRWLGLSGL
jgi:protein-S-isoprenylcysteine O-methyltransferase Ste14